MVSVKLELLLLCVPFISVVSSYGILGLTLLFPFISLDIITFIYIISCDIYIVHIWYFHLNLGIPGHSFRSHFIYIIRILLWLLSGRHHFSLHC